MSSFKIYQHGWLMTIKGAIVILFGLIALLAPGVTAITLATIFGVIALIGGILLLLGAYSHSRTQRAWQGWTVEGILDVLVGIFLIAFPEISIKLFVFLLATWAIIMGTIYITGAIRFQHVLRGWQFSLVGGIISLLFGLLLIYKPFEGAMAFTSIAGILAIIIGAMIVYHSFTVRRLGKHKDNDTYIYID